MRATARSHYSHKSISIIENAPFSSYHSMASLSFHPHHQYQHGELQDLQMQH